MRLIVTALFITLVAACTNHKSVAKDFFNATIKGDAEALKNFMVDEQLMLVPFALDAQKSGKFNGCKVTGTEEVMVGEKEMNLPKDVYSDLKKIKVEILCTNDKAKQSKTKSEEIFVVKKDGKYKVIVKK